MLRPPPAAAGSRACCAVADDYSSAHSIPGSSDTPLSSDIGFEVLTNNIADDHSGYFYNNNWKVTTKSLKAGEDADLSIDVILSVGILKAP